METYQQKIFTRRYVDSKKTPQFMYFHRVIVNFKKYARNAPYFLHLVYDTKRDGTGLLVYPYKFTDNYIIAYGVRGTFSHLDPDTIYCYHTAFDIKQAKVKYVPIDMNGNTIINTPFIKPRIFALNGQYKNITDANNVLWGYSSLIITPVNCKILKCFFFYNNSNVRLRKKLKIQIKINSLILKTCNFLIT